MKFYGFALRFLFVVLLIGIAVLLLSNLMILSFIDQKMVIMILIMILLIGDCCFLFNIRERINNKFLQFIVYSMIWPAYPLFYWDTFDDKKEIFGYTGQKLVVAIDGNCRLCGGKRRRVILISGNSNEQEIAETYCPRCETKPILVGNEVRFTASYSLGSISTYELYD